MEDKKITENLFFDYHSEDLYNLEPAEFGKALAEKLVKEAFEKVDSLKESEKKSH